MVSASNRPGNANNTSNVRISQASVCPPNTGEQPIKLRVQLLSITAQGTGTPVTDDHRHNKRLHTSRPNRFGPAGWARLGDNNCMPVLWRWI